MLRSTFTHPALAVAGLLVAMAAHAEVVYSNLAAPPAGGQGNRTWAVEWTQGGGYHDVSISAALFGIDDPRVTARAWLSTALGPGARPADVVAFADISSPTLFTDLDLGPDTYYLVVQVRSGAIAAGWRYTMATAEDSAPDVQRGASFSTDFLDFPAFAPGGDFTRLPPTSARYQFAVEGTPDAAGAVPEPASAALFGMGLVGMWVSGRRRRGGATPGPAIPDGARSCGDARAGWWHHLRRVDPYPTLPRQPCASSWPKTSTNSPAGSCAPCNRAASRSTGSTMAAWSAAT